MLWLGIVKDLVAQIIMDLAWDMVSLRKNLDVALAQLWDECVGFGGKVAGIPLFKTSLFSWAGSFDYPTVLSKVKGAPIKAMLRWLHAKLCLGDDMHTLTPYQRVRAATVWHLMTFYSICKESWVIFSPPQAKRASMHGWAFLRHYQALSTDAFHNGRCAYKVRPKGHYFGHTLLELVDTLENPLWVDLFGAEDMVGQVKRQVCTPAVGSVSAGSVSMCNTVF
jgi:hypothetical protein